MRRLSLPTKLLIAVLPLIVALGGLLILTIRDGFRDVDRARLGAQLGATWEPLVTTMRAIETERAVTVTGDPSAITQARRDTNQLMADMDTSLRRLGESQPLLVQLGQTLQTLSAARGAADNPAVGVARGLSADDSFNATKANLVAVGRLLPTEAGDTELARTLTAVAALAEVEQGSIVVWNSMEAVRRDGGTTTGLDRMIVQIDRVESSVDLFRATADDRWTTEFRDSGYARALSDTRRAVTQLVNERAAGDQTATLTASDVAVLAAPVERIAELRDELALEVVATSDADASDIARQTWISVAVTALAVLMALALAFFIVRSITRRVRTVSGAAQEVSTERLPILVDALRDPRGRTELPDVIEIDARGSDELAELAQSFNALQATLGEVAHEQIEVLRRGVSDIFVTMARRNRSLVDRQLQLLDELEAAVEDPEVLSDYYRLDHLATRMRRNSESLLVLANTDTMRRRNKPASIDDVVRAAIGEVEDYRRVDIMSLEHLNVRGAIVADVAHLLAELLDNATAFSPPSSRVQITGDLFDGEYRILILDDGMGISADRLAELNDLLAHPPVIGLSVEPTLGMSVVSLLAAKHGVTVQLAAGATGTIVKVVLPPTAFERRVSARDGDAPGAPGQLTLHSTAVEPSTSSAVLAESRNGHGPVVTAVDDVDEHEPAEPATPAKQTASTKQSTSTRKSKPAKLSRRQRRRNAKAGTTAGRAGTEPTTPAKAAINKIELPQPGPTETVTPETAAEESAGVIGDPLSIRLPMRVVDDVAPTTEVPVTESPLPTRMPRRDTAPAAEARPSREAALEELDFDLADLDVTPSWARQADTPELVLEPTVEPAVVEPAVVEPTDAEPTVVEPTVAEPTVALAPDTAPVPTAPTLGPTTLGAPPSGPMLPPPTGGPAHPAPQPATGAPVPPPPMPMRGTDGLPLRSRSGSSSALLEVDRLGEASITAAGPPSALKAALSAFDAGRQGAHDRDAHESQEEDPS